MADKTDKEAVKKQNEALKALIKDLDKAKTTSEKVKTAGKNLDKSLGEEKDE